MAGDELLRQVARDIETEMRNHNHRVSRLGGDQFGVLLFDTPPNAARKVAERLRVLFNRRFIWRHSAFNITASIGMAPNYATHPDSFTFLTAAGDAASLAKESGGDTVRVYESSSTAFVKRRGEVQWISRINEALENDRFELWFQPITRVHGRDTHTLRSSFVCVRETVR